VINHTTRDAEQSLTLEDHCLRSGLETFLLSEVVGSVSFLELLVGVPLYDPILPVLLWLDVDPLKLFARANPIRLVFDGLVAADQKVAGCPREDILQGTTCLKA
jgi:hypothetical protein